MTGPKPKCTPLSYINLGPGEMNNKKPLRAHHPLYDSSVNRVEDAAETDTGETALRHLI